MMCIELINFKSSDVAPPAAHDEVTIKEFTCKNFEIVWLLKTCVYFLLFCMTLCALIRHAYLYSELK